MKSYRAIRYIAILLVLAVASIIFLASPVLAEGSSGEASFEIPQTLPDISYDRLGLSPTTLENKLKLDSSVSPDLPSVPNATSHAFANPAGCAATAPQNLTSAEMLANIQAELGDSLDLSERRLTYIWNGPQNTMMTVTDDAFAYEFSVNVYEPPFTYKADQTATIFLQNGFVVWFRSYGGQFRLLAVPMLTGVYESPWGDYVKAYWQVGGVPNDRHVQPVTKKLPCHWAIDQGWVTDAQLQALFVFDWSVPDYLSAGRKFLASTCEEANRISQEEIGY